MLLTQDYEDESGLIDDNGSQQEEEEERVATKVSLNLVIGFSSPRTMKLRGSISDHEEGEGYC